MDKKIAVITDIHGNLEGLIAVLEDIKNRNINEIYCLGDIINIGPNSKECIDLLIENNVKTTLGNHEVYMLRKDDIDPSINGVTLNYYNWIKDSLGEVELNYLKKCPLFYELDLNRKVYLSHYLINDINSDQPFEKKLLQKDLSLWKKYNDDNIYVIGHLHESIDANKIDGINNNRIVETNEPINIIVVDSAGLTKTEEVGYMIINDSENTVFERIMVSFDKDKFIDKVMEVEFPDKKSLLKNYNCYLRKKD